MKKNKLFLCFRPLPIETEHRKPNDAALRRSDHGGTSTFTAVRKIRHPNTPAIEPPVLDIENRGTKSRCRLEQSISSRSFSRILKSILFEASLKNRVDDKTGDRLIRRSKTDGSRKLSKWSLKSNDEFVKPSLSRTNSTLKIEKYRPESFKDKKQSNYSRSNSLTVENCSSSYSGLYLILITLCITILCGRLYAILLMSLWVYCTPRRREICRRRSERKVELPEMVEAEVEYEKIMVIMEEH